MKANASKCCICSSPFVEVSEWHPNWIAKSGDLRYLQHAAVLQLPLDKCRREFVRLLVFVWFYAPAQKVVLSTTNCWQRWVEREKGE